MAILEESAKFRKRIDEALEKARLANEEEPEELSPLELICLLLGSLLSYSADAVVGEELEETGMRKKDSNTG
jgi:hypothetical protein